MRDELSTDNGAVRMPKARESQTIVPANEASWDDLQAVFGPSGQPHRCQCQRYRTAPHQWDREWPRGPIEPRAERLREQTQCGHPKAKTTSGLVAYLDGEPVGWCAIAPRSAYVRLGSIPWAGRDEDRTDSGVWAVTCFVTRTGFRRQGITRALARAAVDFARRRGARALEAYPMVTEPGRDITWGELHVGARNSFAAAGFTEVSRPSLRRRVMRIDFKRPSSAARRKLKALAAKTAPR